VVGWSDPEGARPLIGALLLGYYNGDGRLVYAGRVGTGFTVEELRWVYAKLKPLVAKRIPLAEPPPRNNRFGSPLELAACIGYSRSWWAW
jgi:ATP-dependent DNA ligase